MSDTDDKHVFHRARVVNPADMLAYATAGKAVFTLVGKSSRYTYKVEQADNGRFFFVSLLTGNDNFQDFKYMGTIRSNESAAFDHFGSTKKSRIGPYAPGFVAFAWFWKHLHLAVKGPDPYLSAMEFWHEGKCGRCGRRLTVPESIERGIGPECASIVAGKGLEALAS